MSDTSLDSSPEAFGLDGPVLSVAQCEETGTDLSTCGYTFLNDGTIEATRDEFGNILNPDLIMEPNQLCKSCTKLITEMLAIKKPERLTTWPVVAEEWRQGVLRGCHRCAGLYQSFLGIYDVYSGFGPFDLSDCFIANEGMGPRD